MEKINSSSIDMLDEVYKRVKKAIDDGCNPTFNIHFDTRNSPLIDRSVISFQQTELTGKFSITIDCY